MSLARKTPPMSIQEDQIPDRFVVRQGNAMLVLGLLLIVVMVGAALWNVMQNGLDQSRDMLVAAGFCLLVGAVVMFKYKNHRLEVDGEELRYVSMFGQETRFRVSDIGCVRRDISENPKLMSNDGLLLARFERNMENFPLMIAYLKKYHISAE